MKSSTQRHSSSAQVAVRPGGAHLGEQLLGPEAAAHRDRHRVLRQQIERPLDRLARLDRAGLERRRAPRRRPPAPARWWARRSAGSRLPAGGRSGRRAGSGGPTALGAPDLEHAVHRREVHAEVEGRSADDAAEPAFAEPVLHPLAGVAVHRAVMQRDNAGPVGRAASIAWNQISAVARVLVKTSAVSPSSTARDHLGQQPQADLPRPGEALHRLGDERVHLQRLGHQPLEDAARPRPAFARRRRAACLARYRGCRAWRRGPSVRRPGRKRRRRASASSVCTPRFEAISSCHSSTTTSSRWSNSVGGIVAGEEQREALGCGDQRRRQALALAGSHPRGRCRRCGTRRVQGRPRSSTGARSAASVSAASARSGVIHSTLSGAGVPPQPRAPE